MIDPYGQIAFAWQCNGFWLFVSSFMGRKIYLWILVITGYHTHTHPFNGPLSRTTRVSRYQKGKTNLDFTAARDSEWQCHQLGHMQVCTSLQTDNHTSTPPLCFFTGRMPFLPPNQQRQSTEGTITGYQYCAIIQCSYIDVLLTLVVAFVNGCKCVIHK